MKLGSASLSVATKMSRSATCSPLASPKAVRPGELVPYRSPGESSHRGVKNGNVLYPDTLRAPSAFEAPATQVTARYGKSRSEERRVGTGWESRRRARQYSQ